jgi:hypothetical protein
VRRAADLENGRSDFDSGPGWHVSDAEIQVDVELVAGEWPPGTGSGQERYGPSIHHRYLSAYITVTSQPAVADQARPGIEVCLVERLTFVLRRAPNDELDRADICR